MAKTRVIKQIGAGLREWDYLYGALDVVGGNAHFLHLPEVSLDCYGQFLGSLAERYPGCHHVVIADQAGFHFEPGDPRLPERVHILPLPPYSPELAPCEQAWRFLKESVSNAIHDGIEQLRDALFPGLCHFWEEPSRVRSLVGRPWLHYKANASSN